MLVQLRQLLFPQLMKLVLLFQIWLVLAEDSFLLVMYHELDLKLPVLALVPVVVQVLSLHVLQAVVVEYILLLPVRLLLSMLMMMVLIFVSLKTLGKYIVVLGEEMILLMFEL